MPLIPVNINKYYKVILAILRTIVIDCTSVHVTIVSMVIQDSIPGLYFKDFT